MKRIIVDYSKLTNEILNLLVEKFPDGYDDSNIIRFKNHKNETIEAVEVQTKDTIFLVKISTKLSDRIINFDEDEDIVVPIEDAIKDLDLDDEDVAGDDDEDEKEDKPEFDEDEDEDTDPSDIADDDEDEDDEI